MRYGILGATAIVLLSLPAWARDVAVPLKDPAVTLTIPDSWDIKNIDAGVQTIPPDKAVYVYANYGARSELETTLAKYRDWMKSNKIVVNKPSETTTDFAGTPGRVIRYDTKGKNGKTIVDFIVLNASRDRYVILTVWGSADERAGDVADLTAIMASVKIPPDAGGAPSSTSGNSAANSKTVPSKPEAASPQREAVAAPPAAVAKATTPLAMSKLQFVSRVADRLGDIEARPTSTFTVGEKMRVYYELSGETIKRDAAGRGTLGVILDYAILDSRGAAVDAQKAITDEDYTTDVPGEPGLFFNSSFAMKGAAPGAYTMVYTMHDKLSERTTEGRLPFTLVPPPVTPPASQADAAQASTTTAPSPRTNGPCAIDGFRSELIAITNGAPAFQDGQRQLKVLTDPETLLNDTKGHKTTCRYMSVWTEKQDAGTTERRMKMIYKITENSQGNSNIAYEFDQ